MKYQITFKAQKAIELLSKLNKSEFFEKLRELFCEMKSDIEANRGLYSNIELDFYDKIMKSDDYEAYKKYNMSIIGSLRKNVRKNVCKN